MFTAQVENESEFTLHWLRRVVPTISEGIQRAVNMAATEGAAEAKTRHQFTNRTGDLERSIAALHDTATRQDYGSEIVALKKYASWVENGTRPHVISAKNVKALHFIWKDVPVFFKRVNHPGSKPHVYMGLAYFKAQRVLQRESELATVKAQQALDS